MQTCTEQEPAFYENFTLLRGALQSLDQDRDALTSSTKDKLCYSSCATPWDRGWAFTSDPPEQHNAWVKQRCGCFGMLFLFSDVTARLINTTVGDAMLGGLSAPP